MKTPKLKLSGAHEHNLKNVSLELPHNKLVVFTGVSGSGKSSLAFDTIFKEGQRRYVESLSSYARQFISRVEKPKVDHIEGLFPTVAIDQKTVNRNPRSTVGTVTEINDHLRLLFARLGEPHCPRCGDKVVPRSPGEITRDILSLLQSKAPGGKAAMYILAPFIVNRRGEFRRELDELRKSGYSRLRVDGAIVRLDENLKLERRKKHTVEVVTDRLKVGDSSREAGSLRARVSEAVTRSIELTKGSVKILVGDEEATFSTLHACSRCGVSIPELEPKMFSFNTPQGMCPECKGLGVIEGIDPDLVIPDKSKSIRQGAIASMTRTGYLTYTRMNMRSLEQMAGQFGFSIDTPWEDLSERHRNIILYGTRGKKVTRSFSWVKEDGSGKFSRSYSEEFAGLIPLMTSARQEKGATVVERFISQEDCPACSGARLRPESLSVTFRGKTIIDVSSMTSQQALDFFNATKLQGRKQKIGGKILKELKERLGFLVAVGLPYLTLDRSAATLAGGEAQRIRLATQVGSGLEGVLYVLDEPSIGLHQRDNKRLLKTLGNLRDRGNSVYVIEHDEETMRYSDLIVDIGPGAGELGGRIVDVGTAKRLQRNGRSMTGHYLKGTMKIGVPETRRKPNGKAIVIKGASEHNLKAIDVEIPLGVFVCVTGVSGSGKSTLVDDVLRKGLARKLHGSRAKPGRHKEILGIENIDKVIEIDQSPIGRTPRSNPATYTGAMDIIRDLFASTPEAKVRGYKKGRFSFNVKGGRCEACSGNGTNLIEMQFLPDVEVECPVCEGRRFNSETLEVRFKGKSIIEVLEMSIGDAEGFFRNIPRLHRIIKVMNDVGLGYVRLGQSSTTLSGGEAQRIKLSYYLGKPGTGKTLYLLDEPTTGLHSHDVKMLLDVLNRLVDKSNTVLVVEHNPDVIKSADWIIDMGPEGGDGGGRIVGCGIPEEIAKSKDSHTGEVLRHALAGTGMEIGKSSGASRKSWDERFIHVKGAREHNLKNVDVKIPKNKLTVVTGVSGSGKSSLAFDTLFVEGQRRYVESLSTYARQFLGRTHKPDVDFIEGISPSIAIDQKNVTYNPRSTVATQTEIYDYLRLLFARLGQMHCPECAVPVQPMTSGEIVRRIVELPPGRTRVIAPYLKNIRSGLKETLETLNREGFLRVLVDGNELRLDDEEAKKIRSASSLDIVVDRIDLGKAPRRRIAEAVELALKLGKGTVVLDSSDAGSITFHREAKCDKCGMEFPLELSPRMFSFNNYTGFCETCKGFGYVREFDEGLLIPDESLSFEERAFKALMKHDCHRGSRLHSIVETVGKAHGFSPSTPIRDLTKKQRSVLLYGAGKKKFSVRRHVSKRTGTIDEEFSNEWKGLVNMVKHWRETTNSHGWIWWLDHFTVEKGCQACAGERLNPVARSVRFAGMRLPEVCDMSVRACAEFFDCLKLGKREGEIAKEALTEVRNRLSFMTDVGLDYLTLSRGASTLSGGESQRIRLATQIGSKLSGVLYVLDEPTIGLHPRDVDRLLRSLRELRDLGNSLVVVEHDPQTMREADRIVDLGIGAGRDGGKVIVNGSYKGLLRSAKSLTGSYLDGRLEIPVPGERRQPNGDHLRLRGARQNNLKNVDVDIPLGVITCVTGVSGSGKSSLVVETLYPALASKLNRSRAVPGPHDGLDGIDKLDKVIVIDQTPIGRTPKSNAATYTDAMTQIRQLFASLPESRKRGYVPGRFSFNRQEGVCGKCGGNGSVRIEMHFLPDVWIECDECIGRRYNAETLDVKYKGASIADVLDMPISKASALFENIPGLKRTLGMLCDVGLGYLTLGQSSTTLSGGEAQRVKLATELCKRSTGRTLYLLDEPTTGLHFADVHRLVEVLHRLADMGNTVVVIEHNLDVIKVADHVVDLGPEGGELGGHVVATGTPEEIAKSRKSHTGKFLEAVLPSGK